MAYMLRLGDTDKIKEKLSDREFEGHVYSKIKPLDDLPDGKLYIVNIKTMEGE